MCVSGPGAAVERLDEREQALGRRERAQRAEPGQGGGDAREAAAAEKAQAEPRRLDRIAPARLVRREVGAGQQAAALVREREQRRADRAGVRACGALLGERLERRDEARAARGGRRARAALRRARTCVRPRASSSRARASRRHAACAAASRRRRARGGAPARRAVRHGRRPCAPQLAEAGGHAGDGARRRADGVVHELGAERHLEVQQLRPRAAGAPSPGHRAEAVEVARRAGRASK